MLNVPVTQMVPVTVRILPPVIERSPLIFLGPIIVLLLIERFPSIVSPTIASSLKLWIFPSDKGIASGPGSSKEVSQDLLFPDPVWQYMVPDAVALVTELDQAISSDVVPMVPPDI